MTDAAGPELHGLDLDVDLGGDGLDSDLGDLLDFDLGDLFRGPAEPEPPDEGLDLDLDQQGRARDRSRGGRPTLYTTPRVLAILAALFGGATRAEAARRSGVGASTFYVWLRLGRAGHPTFAPLAEAVANVEDARGLNLAFGHVIRRRRFWKAFP